MSFSSVFKSISSVFFKCFQVNFKCFFKCFSSQFQEFFFTNQLKNLQLNIPWCLDLPCGRRLFRGWLPMPLGVRIRVNTWEIWLLSGASHPIILPSQLPHFVYYSCGCKVYGLSNDIKGHNKSNTEQVHVLKVNYAADVLSFGSKEYKTTLCGTQHIFRGQNLTICNMQIFINTLFQFYS